MTGARFMGTSLLKRVMETMPSARPREIVCVAPEGQGEAMLVERCPEC